MDDFTTKIFQWSRRKSSGIIGKFSLPIITKENWSRHEHSASETRPNCVRVIYGRYYSYQNGGGELSKMGFVLINCDSNI